MRGGRTQRQRLSVTDGISSPAKRYLFQIQICGADNKSFVALFRTGLFSSAPSQVDSQLPIHSTIGAQL